MFLILFGKIFKTVKKIYLNNSIELYAFVPTFFSSILKMKKKNCKKINEIWLILYLQIIWQFQWISMQTSAEPSWRLKNKFKKKPVEFEVISTSMNIYVQLYIYI